MGAGSCTVPRRRAAATGPIDGISRRKTCAVGERSFLLCGVLRMSTCRQLWQLSGVVASLALAGLALTGPAVAEEATGRMATYEKAPGESYFALSVMPKVAADPAQTNEVVVLFDTSASQAGAVRDEALVALDALLAGLGPQDRVKLMAVDVKAIPLTEGFVAAGSPEMQAGLAKLRQRTPLGATDLDVGLRTAAATFTGDGA